MSRQFPPYPQDDDRSYDARYKIEQITGPFKIDIQQVTDERAGITADDTDNEIQAASFSLAAHYPVGNVTNQKPRNNGPCRKLCNVS